MELYETVILAAIEEFNEKGLKFTMEDIAKRLSISKKTIYTVFESKEELIDAIADYSYAGIKREEEQIIRQDIDIVKKIHDVIIALPDIYKHLDFRKLVSLKDKYPATYTKVINNIENNWDSTIALIEQGVQEGRIRAVNVMVLKAMISASIEYFLSTPMLKEDGYTYNDMLEEMMNIIMKGIEI